MSKQSENLRICSQCGMIYKESSWSHNCLPEGLDVLFFNKPDKIVSSFDKIRVEISEWGNQYFEFNGPIIMVKSPDPWLKIIVMDNYLILEVMNYLQFDESQLIGTDYNSNKSTVMSLNDVNNQLLNWLKCEYQKRVESRVQ